MRLPDPPVIDGRSARDIVEQVTAQLGLARASDDPLAWAIVEVFARYCAIVVGRLNRAPDAHYRAFVDLLGLSPRPPEAARVALRFDPVARLPQAFAPMVPSRTRVAAPAGGGDAEPVLFETTQPLQLTHAELVRVIAVDGELDRYRDLSALATGEEPPGSAVIGAARPLEHALCLGSRALVLADGLSRLQLDLEVDAAEADFGGRPSVRWVVPGPQGDRALAAATDTTEGLTRSGAIVFDDPPAQWPGHVVGGSRMGWLECRLSTRPDAARNAKPGRRHPAIRAIALSADCAMPPTDVEHALFNSAPLDTSKDFFPLGERPRFGDVFYFSAPAFAREGARIRVELKLTNPASAAGGSPIAPVSRSHEPRLQWEAFVQGRWTRIDCQDGTRSLTEDGSVTFMVPAGCGRASIGGIEAPWMRARLVSGDYGVAHEAPDGAGPPAPVAGLAVAPPAIQRMAVSGWLRLGPLLPDEIVSRNGMTQTAVSLSQASPLEPFAQGDADPELLYLGLRVPAAEDLAGRLLSLYFRQARPADGLRPGGSREPQRTRSRWQCWSSIGWVDCEVTDQTDDLRSSGVTRVRMAEDVRPWRQCVFGPDLYWLRRLRATPDRAASSGLERIALNTVPAEQAVTLENELLGSGNGRPNQVFHCARAPVLGDPVLEVREPAVPADRELEALRDEAGAEAVTLVRDARGQVVEVWVRWQRVHDFAGSGEHARHYVLDALAGRIQFGDGMRGAIPAAGANGIRLRRYRTGGGSRGNLAAKAVVQLRSAVPYVESVLNPWPATGGRDAEGPDSLRRRGSSWLRHRDRAVGVDDYEDLARQASADVARAGCFPATRFSPDPFARHEAPGAISLIVVPGSADQCPRPLPELLERVRESLDAHRPADVDLMVLGPRYVAMGVDAEIVAARGSEAVDLGSACSRRLTAFLHPLTGGPDGAGWRFGQAPSPSELRAALASMPDVAFIRSLGTRLQEDAPGVASTNAFLICSGTHRIGVLDSDSIGGS